MSYKKPIIHSAPRTVPCRHELNRHHETASSNANESRSPSSWSVSNGFIQINHLKHDLLQ